MATVNEPQLMGTFKSTSRPGLVHKVIRATTGGFWCTCEGWRFTRNCWHLKEVLVKEATKKSATKKSPRSKPSVKANKGTKK